MDSILSVKEAIQARTGIATEEQRLVLGTSTVKDLAQKDLLVALRRWLPHAWPGDRVNLSVVRRPREEGAHLRLILSGGMNREDLHTLSTRDELIAALLAGFLVRELPVAAEPWTDGTFVREVFEIVAHKQTPSLHPAVVRRILQRVGERGLGARHLFQPVIYVLRRAPEALKEDHELILQLMETPWILDEECAAEFVACLPRRLTADKDFVMQALSKCAWVFSAATAELQADPEVLSCAVLAHYECAVRRDRFFRKPECLCCCPPLPIRARRSAQEALETILAMADPALQLVLRRRLRSRMGRACLRNVCLIPLVFLVLVFLPYIFLYVGCTYLLDLDLVKLTPSLPGGYQFVVAIVLNLAAPVPCVALTGVFCGFLLRKTSLGNWCKLWDPIFYAQLEITASSFLIMLSCCGRCKCQEATLNCWERILVRFWAFLAALLPRRENRPLSAPLSV